MTRLAWLALWTLPFARHFRAMDDSSVVEMFGVRTAGSKWFVREWRALWATLFRRGVRGMLERTFADPERTAEMYLTRTTARDWVLGIGWGSARAYGLAMLTLAPVVLAIAFVACFPSPLGELSHFDWIARGTCMAGVATGAYLLLALGHVNYFRQQVARAEHTGLRRCVRLPDRALRAARLVAVIMAKVFAGYVIAVALMVGLAVGIGLVAVEILHLRALLAGWLSPDTMAGKAAAACGVAGFWIVLDGGLFLLVRWLFHYNERVVAEGAARIDIAFRLLLDTTGEPSATNADLRAMRKEYPALQRRGVLARLFRKRQDVTPETPPSPNPAGDSPNQ